MPKELSVILAQQRAREICALLAGELSKTPESELVALLVGEALLKETALKIAAKDGTEAAYRRWLAFTSDVTAVVLAAPASVGRPSRN
jgi:hypothetical protein